MTLQTQIYTYLPYPTVIRFLFLATVVYLLSIFLAANRLHAQVTPNGTNTSVLNDSLPPKAKKISGNSLGTVKRDSLLLNDSTAVFIADTISLNDTINAADQDDIKDIITYKAEDSIVYDMGTKKMYLYNGADVHYQKIQLNSNLVDFDWNTFTLTSQGTLDSTGALTGKPVFTDDGKEYRATKIRFNMKTKKGIVYEVVTKEGDAYIHSEQVKKNEFDEWYGKSSRYTTCDLDHPHFYFKSKKVKIVPNKVMVTGPANLWVADVPTPLYLPFGLFPVKQGKRSGLVLPEYGQIGTQAFFLRNGGYYWAVNDYLGLKFTGQVATNGLVGAGMNAQYALRYKFNGSLAFNWVRTPPNDPDLPNAKASNSYSVAWSHIQDSRSIPNSTFGASVQMQSADFYQASFVTDSRLLNTSFNSSVNYSKVFVGTPLSLSVNLRHDQNILNRTIGFSLPVVRLSMSRVSPFKSKVQAAKPKWYESIGFTYSFEFQNRISTYDSILFNVSTLDRMRMGINQNFAVDAPVRLFKYLNLTPSFQYQERTYFKGINHTWNPDTFYVFRNDGSVDTINGSIVSDTVWRFNSARNFSASVALSTKLIGIFKFKGKLLKAIKHVFTPSVAFSYSPDFSAARWNYYKPVQSDAEGNTTNYSVFEPDAVYGIPGSGQVAALSWNLANNFEMKTYSKKDTVNHEQKMGLLDQVNLSGGYNFIADSLRLQPFRLSVAAARIFNLISLNFDATFDPYAVDSNNRKINRFEWNENRRLLRFSTANISATMSLHSKPRATQPNQDVPPSFMGDYVVYQPDQLYDFDIPWNFGLGYNFNISRGTFQNPDTILTVQSVRANLDFNLTKNWKVILSSGFDITRKQLTLTNVSVARNLHCWELNFTWTPALPTFDRQQFTIILQPKSPTLKDLKVQRKNPLQD